RRSGGPPWPWPRWSSCARARSATRRGWRRAPSCAPRRGRASYRTSGASFVPERQPVGLEGLADFLDRLLAEIRNRGELALGLRDEVADRLDADTLEAVVAPHSEL